MVSPKAVQVSAWIPLFPGKSPHHNQKSTIARLNPPWKNGAEKHGDWTRNGAVYVAVRFGDVRLAEVTRRIAGMKYQAAAQGIKRFRELLAEDAERQRFVKRMKRRLSII